MKNKILRIPVLAGCIGSVLIPASAMAEPGYYETGEVVVTATLSETPVSQIPAAIEVISKEEITEIGAKTFADVLTEVQSVSLEPASGRQSVARMRGLGSRHALVLLDGMRLTAGFQDVVDLSEIPVGMIERVEVVRGSGSALYGSDAVAGVINIITRKPSEDFHAGLTLRGGESSRADAATIVTDGWLSGKSGKFGYVASGTWNNKDRYDRDDSDLMSDGDDRIVGAAHTALSYDLSPSVKLFLGFNYADTELQGYRTQTSGDFERQVDTERIAAYAGLDAATGQESSLHVRAWHSSYDWESNMIPIAGGTASTSALEQTSHQAEARWTGKIAGIHRVTAGVEYRQEDRTDGDLQHEADNFGTFIQDEVQIDDRAGLVLGARYDNHSDFGSATSPKVALWYRLSDMLRLRASYGEGFRAPTLYELYTGSLYTKKKIVYANADLDAERSRSYEVGADLAWKGFSFGVTAFRNDMRDMIHEVFVGYVKEGKNNIPAYELQNISEAMTRGIELTASLKLPYGFTVSDELSFIDTEDGSTGEDLFYVPDVSNTFKLAYGSSQSGFRGNIRVVTVGKQWIEGGERADGYTLVNVYASRQVSDVAGLFLGVDNIFDVEPDVYGNIGGSGSTGTYLYGGVTFNL
jgi:outer membrane receptor for ferrienterochelin and colicins